MPADRSMQIVHASGTPGDWRASKNLLRDLQRSGFVWPWPPKTQRRNPALNLNAMMETFVLPDASACDADDMWGNTGPCEVARPNPRFAGPKEFEANLHALGFALECGFRLSHNEKTRVCFSEEIERSCRRSPWCEEFCYGNGVRFMQESTQTLLTQNFELSRRNTTCTTWPWPPGQEATQEQIDAIADAFVTACYYYDINNLRWHGVGDLQRGTNRILVSIAERYSDFTVWGFTRKGRAGRDGLIQLPVLPNLVFWLSVDRTMDDDWLLQQAEAAALHSTGLAISSEGGQCYGQRPGKMKPYEHAPRLTVQYDPESLAAEQDWFDRMRELAADFGVSLHAAFGYHGKGVNTHLGIAEECPATDPRGGGHLYGVCQECRWCMSKTNEHHDLKTHRRYTIVTDEKGKRYRLDDGKAV